MATTDEIMAAVETAQTAIGEALASLKTDTGLELESVELVDAAADVPVVKVNVKLPGGEEATGDAPKEPGSIDEYFGG